MFICLNCFVESNFYQLLFITMFDQMELVYIHFIVFISATINYFAHYYFKQFLKPSLRQILDQPKQFIKHSFIQPDWDCFLFHLQQEAMIYDSLENQSYVPKQPEFIIGIEEVIIPYHLVKYRYREGGGSPIQFGMTAYCLVDIFLVDGTQIAHSKNNKITKFLYGRNRLIRGLELGLKNIKKGQKFKLVISPDYAYQSQAIQLIPENSRLIFDIQVIQIAKIPVEKMNDAQIYYQVYYLLKLADKKLAKTNFQQAFEIYHEAYQLAKKIKQYRCLIGSKILLKCANICYYQNKQDEALKYLSLIEKYDESYYNCLALRQKILTNGKRYDELEKLMQKTYAQTHNIEIKRKVIDYYKQTQQFEKLKMLPGYNFKKDCFIQVKPQKYQQFRFL